MIPHDDEPEDDRFADLLASGGDGAPPPDREFLDRLREQTTDAFLNTVPSPPDAALSSPRPRLAMKPLLFRLASAAVAATVLIALAWQLWPSSRDEVSLAQVLDSATDAEGLHLQVTRAERTDDVWVSRANKLRWDESADRYLIVQEGRTYRVDESVNRVSSGTGDYFRPDRPGLDVFALLGLARPTPRVLKATTPAERVDRDGRPVDVYRIDATDRDGAARVVEVDADGTTGKLLGVRSLVLAQNGVLQTLVAMVVLAEVQAVPDEKFVVKATLSEDGRVGKFADVQGLVSRKPVLGSRWLPVRPNGLLMPGDWVRADARGANAATLRLLPKAEIIVGPGGLLEITKPNQVRLHEGEAEINPAKGTPIELLGPGTTKIAVTERGFYRIQKELIARIEKEPVWLKGFKGTSANESLGSLVAQVDGRNTPLTVGYHKVTVDIRDQIARTTIEESFVNHTNSQLEGVFHFPLPQDASISGFAMWIGDQMIDADVVEKQRAREIYEEILRERRDPGLLEWTGGNIFKARVWPIFANSEKRIKITYTQVLPLKGNAYRYSYALQSEMLQQHPLRELSLDVKVQSAVPLKAVSSPTHTVRLDKTENAAHVEFSAQQHTPTRDFEVVVEVADKAPAVGVVPHRRGTDGYFLVQLTTPAAERNQPASDAPLHLVLLCDTSASIDPGQRATQATLVNAVLEALTPKDSFNLAACDVNADWAFDRPQAATADNVQKARVVLNGRVSLGWTDLDKMFASALKQCGPNTQVIYLGDGIATTRDANPQAFADRLKAAYKASETTATFHAVALGSTFESSVLKAIGSLGSGSVRRVSGEQGPVAIALELLEEFTRPPVRDLKVEFNGWKTARIYPETLANLVPGTQQILIGRYLPEGETQQGEVIVSGSQNGKTIRYTATATLPDGEAGNSFLPRLWARMHLDKLLEQPQTPGVKDDVIALSEEFGIITPYTSFLVLESDADRERFKVKRRFQMRDGEAFFAKGRDDAEYELARQQMKRAGTWRVGLRRDVLSLLGSLGRDVRLLESHQNEELGFAERSSGRRDRFLASAGGGIENMYPVDFAYDLPGSINGEFFGDGMKSDSRLKSFEVDRPLGSPAEAEIPLAKEVEKLEKDKKQLADRLEAFDEGDLDQLRRNRGLELREFDVNQSEDYRQIGNGRDAGAKAAYGNTALGRSRGSEYQRQRWFDGLFPALPAASKPTPVKPGDWPKEARDLARSLLRRDDLAKIVGGLKVERQAETFDLRDGATTSREVREELFSPKSWAVRAGSVGGQTSVEWSDGKDRGTYGTAFKLGRIRAAAPSDLSEPPLRFNDQVATPLDETYRHMTATVEKIDGKTVLVIRQVDQKYEVRFTTDAEKRVIVRVEHLYSGVLNAATAYSDFVQVGGIWWPKSEESTDAKGRRTARTKQAVVALNGDEFAARVKAVLADRDAVQFLKSPAPSVADAKKAFAAGKATFDDRFVLLNYYAGLQQWAKAGDQIDVMEKLADGKPGVRWLRTVFLQASRRGEELRIRLLAEADALAKEPAGGDRATLADFAFSQGQQVLSANEQMLLVDKLRPAYQGLPAFAQVEKRWKQYRVNVLQNRGDRSEELIAMQKELAADYPREYGLQTQYAQALYQRGEREAAFAFVAKILAPPAEWQSWELDQLKSLPLNWYEGEGRYPELIAYLAAWLELAPETELPYTRYLSALVRGGEQAKAEELVNRWIREAQIEGEIKSSVEMRLRAAANLASGRGHNLYTDRIDPKFMAALSQAARFFANHPKHYLLTNAIFSWQFQISEEGKAIKAELLNRLAVEVSEMAPARLNHLLALVLYNAPSADAATWAKLAVGLKARWLKTEEPNVRHQLGALLAQVLAGHVNQGESLAFLRQQWKDGPAEYRAQYSSQLFEALIVPAWNADRETEAIAMIPQLGDPEQPDARRVQRVVALHRLTDRMIAARYEVLNKSLENPEKLPRPELAKKRAEFTSKVRTEFAERLKIVAWPAELKPWANAERLYLLARTDAPAAPVAAECWAFLGDAPKARKKGDEPSQQQILDDVLTDRYLAMALHFAARAGAAPELVERTLKYLAAGDPTDPHLRASRFQLLVALDRPKDLELVLSEWVNAEDVEGRWRTALGYVLAEQGKLKEAIVHFEEVEKAGELGYAGYQALAGWYQAVNCREPHEKALIASFRTIDEYTLSRLLSAKLQPWYRGSGHVPTELDKDVLRVFAAIFEKSSHPQNYLGMLLQFYQACRDFRLLGVMSDAVIGQSAGKVYPFLQGMGPVLTEVRDEAAADELITRIETLRKSAKTPVDFRALDFLELQVRRRAAELLNQPGPHAAMALAAMKRAFARPMAEGEPLLLSNLIRDLGTIARADLAAEQLRELQVLHAGTKPGTFERMHLAHNYAAALGFYRRYAEGIVLLRAALDEFAKAHDGVLPTDANAAVQALVSLSEDAKQHANAEEYLLSLIAKPMNAPQKLWLSLRLDELYHRTLGSDNGVSLGKGEALYLALEKRIVQEAGVADANHRYGLINLLCAVYRTAKNKSYKTVPADVLAFGNKVLPTLLKTQSTNYENVVGAVAGTVRDLVGAGEAVAFLVDRIAEEPPWLRLNSQDGWSRHGYQLAYWRHEAMTLPKGVEDRLLTLVLGELRLDLSTQKQRNRTLYQANQSYYWAAKEADFARVADDLYAEKQSSTAAVLYIAEYFYHGCNRPNRAIGILLDAHEKKRLDDSGQVRLVHYLHWQKRYGQSIPILVPLVERAPNVVQYRTLLCDAYFLTGKKAELKSAFEAAEAHFRPKDRWDEGAMAALANNAVDCRLYDRAVAIYGELIPLHQRSHANRGIGNGTLSRYYQRLSVAHTGLGKPIDGIDAAGGVIVSWGANVNGRGEALNALNDVLRAAENLDAIVTHLDAQLAETRLVNPIVRKALGRAFFERGKFEQAISQLQVALSGQPNDAETLQLLVESFDKIKDPNGAIAQMVLALQLNRRDIKRYEALGQRLEGLDRGAEAERAYTSIVEVLPNESEGHALLAEIRQKQNRWAEAISHWEQVAQIRALEPTGLLGLAAAQLHEKQWDKAAATIAKLKARSWPQYFGDANQKVAELERQLKK